MAGNVRWTGQSEVKQAMARYAADCKARAKDLAYYWAIQIEAYAKDNASWEDRTTNARQSLFTHVDDSNGRLIIYLSHGVDYGVWLELRYQGRYAIIMRTLENFYTPIQQSYKRLFS